MEDVINITIADKSIHSINKVAWYIEIEIERKNFVAKTIYQLDSGLDIIIGNNFLKTYQPFIQTNKMVSLTCQEIKEYKQRASQITTKILDKYEAIKLILGEIKNRLEYINIVNSALEEKLEEVCGENPLDKIKNKNNELIEIKLKDPLEEVNIKNNIPYTYKDVKEFEAECKELLEKGIIRISNSPHSAPAFYVENNKKKNGHQL